MGWKIGGSSVVELRASSKTKYPKSPL